MTKQVSLVDYLVLDAEPRLVVSECTHCGARYFHRRNACASCFGMECRKADVSAYAEVRSFTIVSMAAPGIPVPFVAATVDCYGTTVRANLVNVDPTPEAVSFGMKVRLATFGMGTDTAGVEAIGFGFEPVA